jgi:hypothetical protein
MRLRTGHAAHDKCGFKDSYIVLLILHILATPKSLARLKLAPRLRYSGASIGFQLASAIVGGPAPLIATALLAATGSGT